jgi:hypothetical protein
LAQTWFIFQHRKWAKRDKRSLHSSPHYKLIHCLSRKKDASAPTNPTAALNSLRLGAWVNDDKRGLFIHTSWELGRFLRCSYFQVTHLSVTVFLSPWIIFLPSNIHGDVKYEVFTEVTMKNAVFLDIKTQFVLHRRHITSILQSPAG